MPQIIIELPKDRSYTGILRLKDDNDFILAGPYLVCGRASDMAASEHGNPSRMPVLPYGDTPTGRYRVDSKPIPTGRGTPYDASQFGSAGVILLEPVSGEAAIAEANGRYTFLIQGGAPGSHVRLRTTNGCIRMFDADLRELIDSLRGLTDVICTCTELSEYMTSVLITIDPDYREADPPLTTGISEGTAYPRVSTISQSAPAVPAPTPSQEPTPTPSPHPTPSSSPAPSERHSEETLPPTPAPTPKKHLKRPHSKVRQPGKKRN
jgi:hypothetical protein